MNLNIIIRYTFGRRLARFFANSPAGIKIDAPGLNSAMPDRTPVIVAENHYLWWLDARKFGADFLEFIFQPYSAEETNCHRASKLENNTKNDLPECSAGKWKFPKREFPGICDERKLFAGIFTSAGRKIEPTQVRRIPGVSAAIFRVCFATKAIGEC